MCIFSGPVRSVSNTNIFVRADDTSILPRRYLVYQMNVSTVEKTAMILPVPGKDVKFINLDSYDNFFKDLEDAFEKPESFSKSLGGGTTRGRSYLPVIKVGNYLATRVPTREDFSRLDPCFSLNESAWEALPEYPNFEYAVFQLDEKLNAKIHPMAFEYVTNYPNELFFPTVHVHDGKVEKLSVYNHTLYFQSSESFNDYPPFHPQYGHRNEHLWRKSKDNFHTKDTEVLSAKKLPLYSLVMNAKIKNQDHIIRNNDGKLELVLVPV